MVRHKTTSQKGLTLTDTLLTLAISGLIISGAGIFFIRGIADNQTNVGLQQFVNMQKSVRELFSSSKSFSGLDNDLMYNSGFVPPDMKTDTVGDMRNIWGGQINVATNSGTDAYFDLSFELVPKEACQRIVSYNAIQSSSTDGLDSITVTANGSDTVFSTFPTDLPSVVTACDDATGSTTITWVMY